MVFKKKEVIDPSEIRVEKIHESHREAIEGFESYEDELQAFLVEDSLNQQKQRISTTYLWFLRESHELIAYITLCPDSVKTKNLNGELSEKIKNKGIPYRDLPSLKIGRLCVDDKYQRRGVGRLLIQFAIHKASKMSSEVGCRFIYLDAKRNEDSKKDVIHFYKRMSFKEYKKRGNNNKETPMYLDILPYIKILESTDK